MVIKRFREIKMAVLGLLVTQIGRNTSITKVDNL